MAGGGNAVTRMHYGALQLLREAGVSPGLWAAANGFPDREWAGACCGCPDPGCISAHHARDEACPCLPALLSAHGLPARPGEEASHG